MVTVESVQGHTGVTALFIFWHSGTLALGPEHQSAQDRTPKCPNVKKLKRVGYTSMALNALVDSFLPQSEKVWDWNGFLS